ncbi:hypothetical protein NM688_g6027 [Phlebia brevispora]|uniref:Uncharacterized protein n=1 Tax=Phlebia brevispora TaxID=194682 RepID=A0ACC1SL51_9APHY|nr:hypothetical protein NM688_g6027 [Phlebia brevispora]
MATLQGKKVVVIGGSSGIGYSVAKGALLSLAEHVLIASPTPAKIEAAVARLQTDPELQKVQSDLRNRVAGAVLDLGDTDAVRTFFEKLGDIDHLVITGGNVATQFAFRGEDLGKHRGIGLYKPHSNLTLVLGTIGAIDALTRALAVELAPVRVNIVSPGCVIGTDVWKNISDEAQDKLLSPLLKKIPVKHLGTADELAEAYLFLMKCTYITGQSIQVDGGDRLV